MNKEEFADSKLWQEITTNNEKAFSAVFDKYFPTLSRFTYSIVTDSEAAEDIVSEVFVKLWLNRRTIQVRAGLKSYLFAASKNSAINYLRNISHNISLDDVAEQEMVSNVSADSELVHNEVLGEFHELLNTLSPQQSMILKLYKLEGLSQKEIAEKLSISIKTVQNHMSLAMKFISEKMASKQYDLYLFLLIFFSAIP